MSVMKAYGVVTLGKPGDLSIGNSEWSYLVALHTSLASDQIPGSSSYLLSF
jgi:hypothetical protein